MIIDEENSNNQKNEEIKKLKEDKINLDKNIFEINLELKNMKEKNEILIKEKNELKENINKYMKQKSELEINNNKLNNEINILKERIDSLNNQIKGKINENNNLNTKISSIMKAANEKFELFEKDMDEIRKDNKSWRKAYEKLLGKKKLSEDEKDNQKEKKDNIIELDENKENNKSEKIFKNEIAKLKISLDNLQTENSLLKYHLSIFQINDSNIFQNSLIMNNYNNNLKNSTIISKEEEKENTKLSCTMEEKYLSLIEENKELKEIIKKLEKENKDLKFNIMNNLLNTNMSSAYNYLNKELEEISKEKSELEFKLNNIIKEKNELTSKYIHYEIENKSLQTENKALKHYNGNLLNQFEKYKQEENEKKNKEKEKQILDLKIKESTQKLNEEKESYNNKIKELERQIKEKNDKFEQIKNDFNHDFKISKTSRMLINYLNKNNESLESKLSEMNKNKENNERKMGELEQLINDKNQLIENLNMNLEENMKKNGDQILRYDELNKEYLKLIDLSKEKDSGENNNLNNNEMNIKKSFSELILCLNKYKEILPFLVKKQENLVKENESLKEQIKKYNSENSINYLELLKIKEKENIELKNEIETNEKEKDKIINVNNIINSENQLIKNDILSIVEFFNSGENNKNSNNKNTEINERGELGEVVEELLKQLINARNIINFLLKEKNSNLI